MPPQRVTSRWRRCRRSSREVPSKRSLGVCETHRHGDRPDEEAATRPRRSITTPSCGLTSSPSPRACLLLSALDAFLARGYHAATTREIGERAGMSPAAVYVHWKAKHDLLFEISRIGHQAVLEVVEQALAQASDDPVERVHAFVSAFATLARGEPCAGARHPVRVQEAAAQPVPPDRRDPRPLRGAHARRAGGRRRGRRLRRGRPRGHDARGALAVHRPRPLVRAVAASTTPRRPSASSTPAS